MNLRVFYLTRRGLSDGYVLFCCFCLSGWKKGNGRRTACSTIVSFLFFCSCFWALLFLDSDDKVTENCGQSSCGDA